MAGAAVLMEEAGCGCPLCPGHGSRGKVPVLGALGGISHQPLSLSAFNPLNPAVPRGVVGKFRGRLPEGAFSCGLCCHLRPPAPFPCRLPNPSWLSLLGLRGVEDLDRKGACLQPFIWPLLMPSVPPDKILCAFLIFIFAPESNAEVSS